MYLCFTAAAQWDTGLFFRRVDSKKKGGRCLHVCIPADIGRPVWVIQMEQDYFAHGSSVIDMPCEIGRGSKIWHFTHIMAGSKIGTNCTIGQNVVVSPGVVLGNNVKVQNNVSVYSGVVCGDGVFLGPSCVFTNVINPRAFIERKNEFRKTEIGKGASIGANATIVCGHRIGKYALIGAGAVVTRDVPDYAVVYGNPARIHGYVCSCGNRLKYGRSTEVFYPICGKTYSVKIKSVLTAQMKK